MTVADIRQAVAAGGKIVVFEYCISILVMSFKRSSPIMFIRPGESTLSRSLPYCLISLVAGWWGFPWGPIWTVYTLGSNLTGGKDVTRTALAALGVSEPARRASVPPEFPSPTEAADRADRKRRRKLMWAIGLGVTALVLFAGLYAVFKIASAGQNQPPAPGQVEFRAAITRLKATGLTGIGNNERATRLAQGMSKWMTIIRESSFEKAGKQSVLDKGDVFRTYCDLRDGQCVFLIHVPELRRFTPDAQASLGTAAWTFADKLLSEKGEQVRLAVALQGLVSFERLLTREQEVQPTQGTASDIKPQVITGLGCERKLVPWFARPVSQGTLPGAPESPGQN